MNLPPLEIEYEEAHISDDDSATIATVVAVCFFIAFVAVSLRLVYRRMKHQHLQNGDHMGIVALVRKPGTCSDLSVLTQYPSKAFTAAFSAAIGIGTVSTV